jgi:serine/threonine protein kinase
MFVQVPTRSCAQNVLIVESPPSAKTWWVKISDFGFSKRLQADHGSDNSSYKGTPWYMAPELLEYDRYASSIDADPILADIWALGATVYELLTAKPAFRDEATLGRYMDDHASFPDGPLRKHNVGQDGYVFVRSCMEPKPDARPPAAVAAEYDFIAKNAPYRIKSLQLGDPSSGGGGGGGGNRPAPSRDTSRSSAGAPVMTTALSPAGWGGALAPILEGGASSVSTFCVHSVYQDSRDYHRPRLAHVPQRKDRSVSPNGSSERDNQRSPDPHRPGYLQSTRSSQGWGEDSATTVASSQATARPIPHDHGSVSSFSASTSPPSRTGDSPGSVRVSSTLSTVKEPKGKSKDDPAVLHKKSSFFGSIQASLSKNCYKDNTERITAVGSTWNVAAELEVRMLKPELAPAADGQRKIMKLLPGDGAGAASMSPDAAETYMRGASTGGLLAKKPPGMMMAGLRSKMTRPQDMPMVPHGMTTGQPKPGGPYWYSAPLARRGDKSQAINRKAAEASMSVTGGGLGSSGRGDSRVLLSSSGEVLMLLSRPNRLSFWETATGRHLNSVDISPIRPSTAVLSRTDDILAYGDPDNFSINLWKLHNVHNLERRRDLHIEVPASHRDEIKGFSRTRLVLALDPRGNTLVAMHMWQKDTTYTRELRTFLTFFDMVMQTAIATVPVPATVNAGTDDKAAAAVDVRPYFCATEDSPDHFFGAVYTADGDEIILTVRRETFVVDTFDKRVRPVLAGACGALLSAHPHARGKVTFASVSRAQPNYPASLLRLWSTAAPDRVRHLYHPGNIVGHALSRCGQYLLSALSNRTVILWEVASGRALLRAAFESPLAVCHAPQFSPCGRFFVTYHQDGARVWSLPRKVVEAATRAPRDTRGWAQVHVGSNYVDAAAAGPGHIFKMGYVPVVWPDPSDAEYSDGEDVEQGWG